MSSIDEKMMNINNIQQKKVLSEIIRLMMLLRK